EVDSILIDEARTPLIISGMVADSAKWYVTFARLVPRLKRDVDYEVDESKRTVAVLEAGVEKVEGELGIDNMYEHVHTPLVHHLQNALRAKELYRRDRDYIVTQGEVKIVDEFTGRVLEGRRYSEGLHQAIEAKENVRIKEENQTLATITIQNYFRMYDKLAGMTGTAKTQLAEFQDTYKLDVAEIPTNRPMIRSDEQDQIFKNEDAKWNAVTDDIAERYEHGQPVLVGTVSIEKSERLSGYLNRRGVPHHVLNAKQHEKEAMIVAQAGRKGSITVATNMAGRGVDILLRGRSGRQGDPGESMFYLSLEDDLMRLFASDRISSIMNRLKWPDDEPITAKIVSRAIESAQKQVEGVNFERRKNVLKYDEVMNTQRQVIYEERRKILEGRELRDDAVAMVDDAVRATVAQYASGETYS